MTPERKAAVQRFQLAIEQHLNGIQRIVGPQYQLSLICRNTGPGDMDVLLSTDDWQKVIACIQKMIARSDVLITGPGYQVLNGGTAIQCMACGMISHNPKDVAERYCGNCHTFHHGPDTPPTITP